MMGRVPNATYQVRGNLLTSSGEKIFEVFSIYGRGGHLRQGTQMPRTRFCSPRIHGDFIQNLALINQAVWEKKMFEIVNG